KATGGVYITAGKLSTFALDYSGQQPNAKIEGDLTNTGADITISDTAYNPPGVTGHKLAVFKVEGNVRWSGGVYRPVIDITANDCDLWSMTGTLTVSGGANGAKIGPIEVNGAPGVDSEWWIIQAYGGITVPVGSDPPVLETQQQAGVWEV